MKRVMLRHGPFLVADLERANAVIIEDTRKNYGERRFQVFGRIGERLYVAVLTPETARFMASA